ncbi:energy transducer TonB [Patiriisocius hiemis]|uniref:Energy transducer TonB n=1 Tax=Patiriisocius hiemis TaxID=3075604 RepID=A0ABU2YAL3_9FLAO|nr:energy transducer TonB [Constantimarinum sp. W242]MDT0555226.1 energy transducer TonB [Constantimarinum sp. W242]
MKSLDHNANQKKPFVSKRLDKKNINIKWNSVRYFQVGIIVSLLLVFGVVNMSFKIKETIINVEEPIFLEPEITMGPVTLEQPKVKIVAPKKKVVKKQPTPQKKITDVVKVDDNTATIDDTPVEPTDTPTNNPVVDDAPPTTTKPVEPSGPANIIGVEQVPIFPGCESQPTREEKIQCMSSKIGSFVSKKFDTDNFDYLESGKTHKIYVKFTIGDNGAVKDIETRAQYRGLEKEAERVINKLPLMEPGRQGSKTVDVVYMIPIAFKL